MAIKSRITPWSKEDEDEFTQPKYPKSYGRFSGWSNEEDEEFLLPSQRAREENKAKQEEKKEDTRGLLQRGKDFVKDVYDKYAKIQIPALGKKQAEEPTGQRAEQLKEIPFVEATKENRLASAKYELGTIDKRLNSAKDLQKELLPPKQAKNFALMGEEERSRAVADSDRKYQLMAQYLGEDVENVKKRWTPDRFRVAILGKDISDLEDAKAMQDSVVINLERGSASTLEGILKNIRERGFVQASLDMSDEARREIGHTLTGRNLPLVGGLTSALNTEEGRRVQEKIERGEVLSPAEQAIESRLIAEREFGKRETSSLQAFQGSAIPSVSGMIEIALVAPAKALKGASAIAKAGAQLKRAARITSTTRLSKVVSEYAERLSDEYETVPTEDGGFELVKTAEGKDPVSSAILAIGNVYASTAIEVILGEVLDSTTKKLLSPIAQKMGGTKIGQTISSSKAGQAVGKFLAGSKELRERAAVDSLFGELFEEFADNQSEKLLNGEPLGMTQKEVQDTAVSTVLMWGLLRSVFREGGTDTIMEENFDKLPQVVRDRIEQKIEEKGEETLTKDDMQEISLSLVEDLETERITADDFVVNQKAGALKELSQRNRPLNEANTQAVIEETVSGQRENERLNTEDNIKKLTTYDRKVPLDVSPESEVTVYRATTGDSIQEGEMVTTDLAKAEAYLPQREGAKVVSGTVKLEDLVFSGGFQNEFVYSPIDSQVLASGEGETSREGALKLGEFEQRAAVEPGTSEFKIHKEVLKLADKYDVLLSEKYVKRGALGTYQPRKNLVNLRGVNSVSVFSHEVLHSADVRGGISERFESSKGIDEQLRNLYWAEYPAPKKGASVKEQRLEGLAMLVQRFVESPSKVKKLYPDLYNSIIKTDGEFYDPLIGEIINDANQIVSVYQGLSASKKIGAYKTSGSEEALKTVKDRIFSVMDKVRYQVQDNKAFIRRLDIEREVYRGAAPTMTAGLLHLNAYRENLSKNMIPGEGFTTFAPGTSMDLTKIYDYNWGDISKRITKWAKGKAEDFENWIIARDQYYQYEQVDKINGAISAAKAEIEVLRLEYSETKSRKRKKAILEERALLEKVVNNLQEELTRVEAPLKANQMTREEVTSLFNLFKSDEDFTSTASQIDSLTKANLEMLSHPLVQIMTPKQVQETLSNHKGYARMTRVFLDETLGLEEGAQAFFEGGSSGKVSSLKARTGGAYILDNPINAYISGSSEIYRKALNQAVMNTVGNYDHESIPGDLFRRVAYKQGMENKNDVVIFYDGYKKQAMYVEPSIKAMIESGMFPKQAGFFMDFLKTTTRTFQQSTTGLFPPFAVTNFLFVDSATAFIMADKQDLTLPVLSALNMMNEALRDQNGQIAQYLKEYGRFGSLNYTQRSNTKLPIYEDLKQQAEDREKFYKKVYSDTKKGVDVTLETLSLPGQKSEEATRAQVYIRARMRGESQMQALTRAAEITGSFYKIGNWWGMGDYIRTLPYFNASIQSTWNIGEAIITDKSKLARAAGVVAFYSTISYMAILAISGGSEEQKRKLADLDPEMLSQNIYFPDPFNESNLWKMKMNPSFGSAVGLLNMIFISNALGKDKVNYGWEDYYNVALSSIPEQVRVSVTKSQFERWVLSWTPHFFSTNLALLMNKRTWPEIQDLEPDYMENIAPRDRVFSSTSSLAKALGKYTNLSPIKIDAFVDGNFGRATRYIMFKPGIWNPLETLFLEKYTLHGSRDLKDISARGKEIDALVRDYKNNSEEFSAEEYMKLREEKAVINEINRNVSTYLELIKEKDQESATEMLPDIWRKMDMYKAGEYELDKDMQKELITQQKKIMKAELVMDYGYPEAVPIVLESTNDKKISIIRKMFRENPDRATEFYKIMSQQGLISSSLRKRIREEILTQ